MWTSWGQWSLCSVTCGLGKEQRYRKCKATKYEFRHADTTVKCEGSRKSTRSCITAACGLYSIDSSLKATLLPEAILMITNHNLLDWKLKFPVCRQKLIYVIREYIYFFSYIIPLINDNVGFIENGVQSDCKHFNNRCLIEVLNDVVFKGWEGSQINQYIFKKYNFQYILFTFLKSPATDQIAYLRVG